jgi:hypothetical protein
MKRVKSLERLKPRRVEVFRGPKPPPKNTNTRREKSLGVERIRKERLHD